MYRYIHKHTKNHIHTYTKIHTYIQTDRQTTDEQTHTQLYVYMFVCMHVCVCICICRYIIIPSCVGSGASFNAFLSLCTWWFPLGFSRSVEHLRGHLETGRGVTQCHGAALDVTVAPSCNHTSSGIFWKMSLVSSSFGWLYASICFWLCTWLVVCAHKRRILQRRTASDRS